MKTLELTEEALIENLKERGLFSKSVARALRQAELSHAGQLRDNGNPYLTEHIYPVALEVVRSCGRTHVPEKVVIAALLHDAIEDDPSYYYETCKKQFGGEVASIVLKLTKTPAENVSTSDQRKRLSLNHTYMERIKDSSSEVKLIKLADRFCNLATIETIKYSHPEKYQRYIDETKDLFLPLARQTSKYFYSKIKATLDALNQHTMANKA